MKPILELIRLEESKQGTFGVLKINKEVFCVTLEPSDQENAQNISSIPAQQYDVARIMSPKYGETFQILDVPGRDHVLIHAGNVVEHTKGCIILGQHWGKLRDARAILNSGDTFKAFMDQLQNYNFLHLTIREVF